MPLSDLVLPYPYVLLISSDSTLGILPTNGFLFGNVVMVYDTSDRVQVGQTVMYDIKQTRDFIYGSTTYMIISAEYVSGAEPIIP